MSIWRFALLLLVAGRHGACSQGLDKLGNLLRKTVKTELEERINHRLESTLLNKGNEIIRPVANVAGAKIVKIQRINDKIRPNKKPRHHLVNRQYLIQQATELLKAAKEQLEPFFMPKSGFELDIFSAQLWDFRNNLRYYLCVPRPCLFNGKCLLKTTEQLYSGVTLPKISQLIIEIVSERSDFNSKVDVDKARNFSQPFVRSLPLPPPEIFFLFDVTNALKADSADFGKLGTDPLGHYVTCKCKKGFLLHNDRCYNPNVKNALSQIRDLSIEAFTEMFTNLKSRFLGKSTRPVTWPYYSGGLLKAEKAAVKDSDA